MAKVVVVLAKDHVMIRRAGMAMEIPKADISRAGRLR